MVIRGHFVTDRNFIQWSSIDLGINLNARNEIQDLPNIHNLSNKSLRLIGSLVLHKSMFPNQNVSSIPGQARNSA